MVIFVFSNIILNNGFKNMNQIGAKQFFFIRTQIGPKTHNFNIIMIFLT